MGNLGLSLIRFQRFPYSHQNDLIGGGHSCDALSDLFWLVALRYAPQAYFHNRSQIPVLVFLSIDQHHAGSHKLKAQRVLYSGYVTTA